MEKQTRNNLKNTVGKILLRISKIDQKKIPTTDEGKMDMKKFKDVPEVKKGLEELMGLGVNGKILSSLGYPVATVLLGKYLNN